MRDNMVNDVNDISEYIENVERGIAGASLKRLWEDLVCGRIEAQKIFDHYASINRPKLVRLANIFANGNLFASQKQTFDVWLEGKEYHRDFESYLDLKATYAMCNWPNPKPGLGVSMAGFINRMVLFPPFERKALANKHGLEAVRKRWLDRRIKEGWEW